MLEQLTKRHKVAMLKAFIFDLDGTLLDTIEDISISCNHVLKEFKRAPLELSEYKRIVGKGSSQLFKDLLSNLSDKEYAKAKEIFEKHYKIQFKSHTKIYPEINKLLTFLKTKGYKLAILSNKPDSFVKLCAYIYLGEWEFDAVYGIGEGKKPKPDPSNVTKILKELQVQPNEAIFVGDTEIDVECAKRADMRSIGVAWGFREKSVLIESGADYIVDTPKDLIKMVGKL